MLGQQISDDVCADDGDDVEIRFQEDEVDQEQLSSVRMSIMTHNHV